MFRFCEIQDNYILFLHNIDNKVPLPKKISQINNRKYIGTILSIENINYYVNLSSYKPNKHDSMPDNIDFIKIGKFCVLNLNNMIPVIDKAIINIDINTDCDENYRNLLYRERRIILKKKDIILQNAHSLYNYVATHNEDDKLVQRCCNFKLLEMNMNNWSPKSTPINSNT